MRRSQFIQLSTLAGIGFLLKPYISLAIPKQNIQDVYYVSPADIEFNALRQGFNKRIQKKPSIIAVCGTALGVQKALLYAKQLKLPVSIKSGGHCMEGFSCGEGSMQIVLTNMNGIVWKNAYEIRIGPACTLKKLYDELLPKRKIIPGGSCAGVAISGLTLGGGYGLMSRLFGLTCDSLTEITMVDGEGRIHNSKTNPELLWACKGGGNGNFGVITEMIFKVHNSPRTMSSYRFRSYHVTVEKGKQMLQTWMAEAVLLPPACFSTCLFNGNTAYILLTNTSTSTNPVQRFIRNMKKVCDKFTQNKTQPIQQALRNYYGQTQATRFKNASAGLYRNYQEIEIAIEEVLPVVFKTKGMILQFNLLGGAIQQPQFEKSSCFPHRAYPFFTELQTYWDKEGEETRCVKTFQQVQQLFEKTKAGAQYRNYPDIDFKNFDALYYGKNSSKLQDIKKQLDPNNIIQHEQSIKLKPD